MKERKYKNDWVNERQLDPKTGREKTVPVYRGSYFSVEKPEMQKQQALLTWVGGLLFLACLFVYFTLDFPGTRVLYVFIPASFALFPSLYWLMGAFSFYFAPEKMTRTARETSAGRILRSTVACAIFAAIALVGDLVFVLFFPAEERERFGLLFFAGALLVSFLWARYVHGV